MNDIWCTGLVQLVAVEIPSSWVWFDWFDIYQAYSTNGLKTLGGRSVLFGTQNVSQWGR